MTSPRHDQLAALLRLLSHPVRLHITLLLRQQPQTVSALAAILRIRQPSLSQHLAALRDADLVYATREAKCVVYAISDGLPARLINALAALTTDTAPAVENPASRQGDELVFATLRFPAGS